MTTSDSYWVHNAATNQPVGPYTSQQLAEYVRTGALTGGHLVCRDGTQTWQTMAMTFPGMVAPPLTAQPMATIGIPPMQAAPAAQSAPPPVSPGWLICITGPDKGARVPISHSEIILGRGTQSVLPLRDPHVVDAHVSLIMVGTDLHFIARDGAKILCNGEKVERGSCKEGDELELGSSVWTYDAPGTADWVLRKVAGGVTAFMGIDRIEAFSFKTLFSDVFRKREPDDVERHMMVGTPATTPPLAQISTFWPKPWLFYRAFLFYLLIFGLLAGAEYLFNNPKLIPALTVVGAFGMPVVVVIFFFELNVARNVSLYQTLRVLILGGIFALAICHFGFRYLPFPEWMGAMDAGPIEESSKVAALLLFVRNIRYNWTLNGLLFGAAVGAGFAIFETAGYAFQIGTQGGFTGLMEICLLRGFLAPGCHVAWTALEGAALWRVKGKRPFNPAMLLDWRFLRIFLLSILLHMTWNSPFELPLFLKDIAIIVVVWLALLSMVQMGLNEIRTAQEEAPPVPPVGPPVLPPALA